MKIAPEGFATIIIALLLALVSWSAWAVWRGSWLLYSGLGFTVVFIFMLFFFRDPARQTLSEPGQIISPADGKVVIIKETEDRFLFNQRVRQVSIFLSPLDVHINRIPVTGLVVYRQYHPGKFLPAFEEKASLDNEQMHLGIETLQGKLLMKQIAGILARRVICYPKTGDSVTAGQRMGLMKFGSRVDLLVPLETEINVKVGDKVKGGITKLGRFVKQ
jgi:phosphatidylserine decarboxylase